MDQVQSPPPIRQNQVSDHSSMPIMFPPPSPHLHHYGHRLHRCETNFLFLLSFLLLEQCVWSVSSLQSVYGTDDDDDSQQQLQKSNDVESNSSASVSERFRYRRTGSKNSIFDRVWGKEMELKGISMGSGEGVDARLKGISMGNGGGVEAIVGTLLASMSGRRPDPVVLVEEIELKEWVAQLEPGCTHYLHFAAAWW
ncbi:hypothetical protein L6452_21283 [Arctium lappa]|uniref:Uncharacterized protein n=1 Tax=Arctium lappa TaxID=4217 RepID=A0ACB9BCX2_ARCLA|nr:hypothetical protein L6452_21283 [Arctium lappa]